MENDTKVIEILDPQAGTVKETVNPTAPVEENKLELLGASRGSGKLLREAEAQFLPLAKGKYATLKEAATTSEFPVLLRDGLKQILFASYADEPSTYQEICQMATSDKPAEDWVEMNRLGTLPVVGEGDPFPEINPALDRTVRIANNKYGAIFSITEEMIRFDRSNQMKQFPSELGAAAKQTIEATVYSMLTTGGNYSRTTAAGDNDVGNNTAATTFSAAGLVTAFGVLSTMKDRKSGRYLGVRPNTLVVTPRLQFAAKQLLLAPDLQIPGDGVTTAKVYGTGSGNPFRGLVNKIIVSPWLGTSYDALN